MLINSDCLTALKELPDNSVDSLVTDPPYGIAFMGKSWDDFSKGQELVKKKLENGTLKPGQPYYDQNHPIYNFEGMIEFFTPIWKEVYRVLKPGAFGFVMCIPRQDCLSRMMISLENAGFNINFTSLYWTYASGFPKALNIGKAIDRRAGAKREVVGKNISSQFKENGNKTNSESKGAGIFCGEDKYFGHGVDVTAPATPDAKRLNGSYGGFQPKPAVEVIIVIMKTLSEKGYVDQALENGKGVTWIDDCRIPYKDENDISSIENKKEKVFHPTWNYTENPDYVYKHSTNGRFPANLLVSDDVLDDGIEHKSQGAFSFDGSKFETDKTPTYNCPGDSGSYSRFFSLDAWAEKNLPFLIVSKASKREKNEGIKSNNHPTVKPLKLMSYLITLGSRPGDVILDPFAGSGTTGVAAVMLNRDYICIERDPEYFKILKARIENVHKKTLVEI